MCPDITPESLPVPEVPTEQSDLELASRAHSLLETWVLAGCNFVFSFETFDLTANLGGEAVGMFTRYLSSAVMARWYGDLIMIPEDLVPKRVAILLYMSLCSIRDRLSNHQVGKAEVQAAFSVLVDAETNKRRKTLAASNRTRDAVLFSGGLTPGGGGAPPPPTPVA